MDHMQEDQLSEVGIEVDQDVAQSMSEMSRWAKFISVSVFAIAGIMLLLGIAAVQLLKSIFYRSGAGRYADFFGSSTALMTGIVIFVVLVSVVIYYFLFNFARKIKSSLMMQDSEGMANALGSLKVFMIITTIITILSLLFSIKNLFAQY